MTSPEAAQGEALGFFTPDKPQGRDSETTRLILQRWMAGRLPAATDVRVGPVEVPTANGVANETMLFDATWTEAGVARGAGFVARLATAEVLFPDVGIDAQARMNQALAGEPDIPVPAVFGYEPDPSFLDTPFYVMEKVEGVVPPDRPHYSLGGWVVDATPTERRRLWHSAVSVMSAVHQVDVDRVGFLRHPERGDSGLEQLLTYWRSFYEDETGGRDIPAMDEGYAWLVAHLPARRPTGLAWGDCRLSNMIFRDFTCVAVLDWDMVSLGGPESDLGWWILQDQGTAKRLPGLGTLEETVALWEELNGRRAEDLRWYVAFNAFRLGAIRIRLAHQMAARGERVDTVDLETNNVAIQQLALLLGLTPSGPITATLPDFDLR